MLWSTVSGVCSVTNLMLQIAMNYLQLYTDDALSDTKTSVGACLNHSLSNSRSLFARWDGRCQMLPLNHRSFFGWVSLVAQNLALLS